MQFSLERSMFMHYHALHVSFLSFPIHSFFYDSLSLSLSWHLKSLFCLKTRFVMVLFLPFLFPLILFSFMIRRHEMTSLRTSLTGKFIQNAKSFCPISQTLLYSTRLALRDEFLYVRNPWAVPTCSYKSFTPTCMPLIPLYLGLLWYSMVHVL